MATVDFARRFATAALTLAFGIAAVAPARANPTGGTVAAGAATIAGGAGTLTVTQTTPRAVINWPSFSIGAGELTQFVLPSTASAILNRVTSTNPSLLYGQVRSNGQVFLINPNGVLIGPSGRIATGGFVASTLDVANAAFMGGGPLAFSGYASGPVVNLGTIDAVTGDVALLAAQVTNAGNIAAPNGLVALASGSQILYLPGASGDITIGAPATAPAGGAAVSNTGSIAAAVAALKAAGSPYALAVNNGGLINATAVENVGGRVVLDGGSGSTVDSGTIAAHAPAGGNVEISGAQLSFTGTVDTTGTGVTGNLLLDPLVLDSTNIPGIVSSLNTTNVQESATDSITVNSQISNATTTNRLTLNAPAIAVNAGISLPNGSLTFDNFSGNAGGALTSASGATIAANSITLSNSVNPFASMAFAGPITAGSLTLTQGIGGGVGPVGSFTATNAANAIGQLQFVGINAFSGAVSVATSGALSLAGTVQPSAAFTVAAGGNLTVAASSSINANGTTTLASTSGAFINDAGGTLFSGSGRRLIYSALDAAPFTDGGLGYTMFNPVAYPSDPIGTGNLEYIGLDSLLPSMTVTGPTLGRTYGQPDPSFTATLTGGTAGNLFAPVTFTVGSDTNAGQYAIVPSAVSSTRSLTLANGTLTVNPAPLTVTVPGATMAYGSFPALNLAGVQLSGLVNGDTALGIGLNLTTNANNTANVGTYAIVSSITSGNYAPTYVNGTMTVTPAPLTVFGPNLSLTYGQIAALSNGAITFLGLPAGVNGAQLPGLELNTSETPRSNVGTYALVPSLTDPNYTVTVVNGKLTVTPAPLFVSVNNATGTVGQIPPLTASFTGFLNGDTSAVVTGTNLATTATSASPAGQYQIYATNFGSAQNYTLTPSSPYGTLTIVSAPPVTTTNGTTNTNIPSTTLSLNTTSTTSVNTNVPVVSGTTYTNTAVTSTTTNTSSLFLTDPNAVNLCTNCVVMPDWLDSGGAALSEENSIVDNYAAASGMSTATIVQDLQDPTTQATMEGNLLPFVYQDLVNILNTPSSQRTAAQQGLVTSVTNFIQNQQEQAATQAAQNYQQWCQQNNVGTLETTINGDGGVTGIYLSAIQSANPPVPPDDFIDEVQTGMVMSNATTTTLAGIEGQVASFGQELGNYQQYGQQGLNQIELSYLQQQNPQQAGYYQELYDVANQPALTGPLTTFNLPGGGAPINPATAAQTLAQLYSASGGAPITTQQLSTQVATIAQANGETLDYIPGTVSDISRILSTASTVSNIAVDASQMVAKLPALTTIFPTQAARLAIIQKSAKIANQTTKTTETVTQTTETVTETTQTTTETTQTVAKTTETAADTAEAVAEGLETVGAFAGPAGLVLELVGNIVQIGVAASQYSSIQQYNQNLQTAISNAYQPVSLTKLQSSSPSLFDYLGEMMAGSMQ